MTLRPIALHEVDFKDQAGDGRKDLPEHDPNSPIPSLHGIRFDIDRRIGVAGLC